MKLKLRGLFAFCLMAVLLISPLLAVRVKAATPEPTFNSVTPAQIVNNQNVSLEILVDTVANPAAEFSLQAKVIVGSTDVEVTSFSKTKLIVLIPANFPPGTYSITVTNPGTAPDPDASFTKPEALKVFAPTPTAPPAVIGRPQIIIETYSISVDRVRYNQDFNLSVSLDNAGGSTAHSLQVSFASTQLLMLNTGGIIAAGDLGVAGKSKFAQKMTAAASTTDLTRVSVDMTVAYTDDKGAAYSDKFTLVFPALLFAITNSNSTPTPAPPSSDHAQLVITEYKTDLTPLQPGSVFTLTLSVQNVGNLSAKGITMIAGGGSASNSGSGTPQPGGISGGSGEFSNFAPVDTSNLQSLGNLAPGAQIEASQKLIVNVSANPGAYPMKFTFSYTDANGGQVNDDQVITLLIYLLPNVDVTFYQPVGDLLVGQQGSLPLQVTSLGKRTAVLGKMKVTTNGGMVTNGEALVGSLDPGGYFTLDSMITPDVPGTLELLITIDYLDDFNQPQTITRTLSLNVMDMGVMPTPDVNNPGGESGIPVTQETGWQKVWRFILGLFGLDSSGPSTTPSSPVPTKVPAPPFKGGGGKG